ncbi:hypothetical protein ACJZ2D_009336 [Fusarium nematophilum]
MSVQQASRASIFSSHTSPAPKATVHAPLEQRLQVQVFFRVFSPRDVPTILVTGRHFPHLSLLDPLQQPAFPIWTLRLSPPVAARSSAVTRDDDTGRPTWLSPPKIIHDTNGLLAVWV